MTYELMINNNQWVDISDIDSPAELMEFLEETAGGEYEIKGYENIPYIFIDEDTNTPTEAFYKFKKLPLNKRLFSIEYMIRFNATFEQAREYYVNHFVSDEDSITYVYNNLEKFYTFDKSIERFLDKKAMTEEVIRHRNNFIMIAGMTFIKPDDGGLNYGNC